MTEPGQPLAEKPFHLEGNFAPIFEEFTDFDLRVTGSIPPELTGRFFRNGANPRTGWSAHWFLGNGMIHGVELQKGRATWYRNRYVRTPLLDDPEVDAAEGIGDLTRSAANTHVIRHAGRILALEEVHLPFEVSPELETLGPYDFGGRLETGMTAHPKVCPDTGELLFFSYGFAPPYLTYYRASATGELVQTEPITVKGATMIHDFNVTRSHVVFMDLPMVWNFEAMAETGLPIVWSEDYGARLGVMPREGSDADVVWYEIDPCYVFHPLNAYDEGDDVVIDVCRLPAGMAEPPALWRWTIDRAAGRVSEQQLDDRPMDFPRLHDGRVGKKHRYGYLAGLAPEPGAVATCFHKVDVATGGTETHELGPGREGGEPVFVAAQGATAEDDGWVLSYVYDRSSDRSELVILDASRFDREPVARIHLPTRVPAGFHGSWLADEVR